MSEMNNEAPIDWNQPQQLEQSPQMEPTSMSEMETEEPEELEIELFLENNQTSFKTNKIKGELDAIIFESDSKVELIIESALGYIIYKDAQIYGTKYLCPRARTTAAEPDLRDINHFCKFSLNEELYITVIGPKKTNVKLLFRFC